jgi:hypothetical protein
MKVGIDVIRFPNFLEYRSMKARTISGMSSLHCRSGGTVMVESAPPKHRLDHRTMKLDTL